MKKLESGRSMVEMLGVLAIIGVLSIGGIAGYTMAMNRNRANNILDTATKLSTIAYARGQSMSATQLANWNDISAEDASLTRPDGVATMTADQNGVVAITFQQTDTMNRVQNIINTMVGEGSSSTSITFGHN